MPTSSALLKKLDALREKEDFKGIVKIVCDEITKAKDGKPIEALEGAEAIEEMFLGEDDAGLEIAGALLKRAFEVGGTGGASLLRMLNVISWYDHAEPLSVTPPQYPHRKTQALSAVEKARDVVHQGVSDKNASFRAASLYLLLSCAILDAQDAECVLQCLAKEKDSTVRLTAILALGVIGKRLSAKDPAHLACVKVVEAESKKKYASKDAVLATTCIACASTLLGVEWDKKLVAGVKASFKKPALLPAAWGYRKGADTTQVLMPALSAQPGSVLEPLIDGIAKIGASALPMLYTLAFGDPKKPICDGLGVVLDELSPLQIRVLTALSGPKYVNSYAFREQLSVFSMESVKEAVEAKTPLWKPIPVKTKKGQRNLAPAIIWPMASRGMIDVAEAKKSLTALSTADLGDIVLYGPDAIYPFNASRLKEDRQRNMELLAEVMTWLELKDATWPKRVRESVTSSKRKIDVCIGYALTRLVAKKKLQFEEGDKDMVQMFVLSAMNGSPALIEYVPSVPPNIRDYIIEDAVPSSVEEIKNFLADHPYKG